HKDALGQLAEYCREQCSRHHRLFTFAISIYRGYARFLVADRAGAVVSRPFDYFADATPLAIFLHRYVHATAENRGFDPTAALASDEERKLFTSMKDIFRADPTHREAFKEAEKWPTYKLRIFSRWNQGKDAGYRRVDRDSPFSVREFLVGRPIYDPPSLTGRCTRIFAACDLQGVPVIIKDYWRAYNTYTCSEYDIYLKLYEGLEAVRNIPTVIGGGDVQQSSWTEYRGPEQFTLSHNFIDEVDARAHSRLVLQEFCRPLTSYRDARELVSVVYDACLAHKDAWEIHGVLHRDVSVGNILIFDGVPGSSSSPIGLLADWELSKTKEQILDPHPSQHARSGTWQFMSVALQKYDWKPHLLSDDLESFMHVLNWIALRHMDTEESTDLGDLAQAVHVMYDLTYRKVAPYRQRLVTLGSPFFQLLGSDDHHPFALLASTLANLCKDHYRELNLPR
ncbi:hypothetical protein FKP32DRAFT_1552328, partial [Trametes sanguinea]